MSKGFGLPEQKEHRSGITHHMVVMKSVMEDLMKHSEILHGGLPFWQIMLNQRYDNTHSIIALALTMAVIMSQCCRTDMSSSPLEYLRSWEYIIRV